MINDIVEQSIFKDTICKHYHGDYGMLYSTATCSGITIWQCACGYRTVTNGVVNDLILKDLIDGYVQTLKVECKDSEDFWDMYCQWCHEYKN